MLTGVDLDKAVDEGIISPAQAVRLRDLTEGNGATEKTLIDFSQEIGDEPFRLLKGFRDFFIAVGAAIFSVGVTAITAAVLDHFNSVPNAATGSRHAPLPAIAWALFLCAVGFVQAEFVTRKQRLPLSSLVVAIALACWSGLAGVAIVSHSLDALSFLNLAPKSSPLANQLALLDWSGGTILGLSFFYLRYRLPSALMLLAGALIVFALSAISYISSADWVSENLRWLIGASGAVVFAAAMWFDAKDRLRVTRFSECAFWLHLLAAPLLVHAILFGNSFHELKPVLVLGTMVAMSLVALLIDRRALLVSGIGYFAFAVLQIVSNIEILGGQKFGVTAFILGSVLLALGLSWTWTRRRVFAVIPFEWLKNRLPPT